MALKQKLNRMISAAALCLALAPSQPASAGTYGSAELMSGHKSTTLDLKVGAELAPRVGLFLRNISTVDYKNKADYFGFGELTYNVVDGLNALVQAEVSPASGIVPGAGAEYIAQVDNLSVYLAAVGTFANTSSPQVELIAVAGYRSELTAGLKLVLNGETFTLVGLEGHIFSAQRIRAGIGIGQFEAGPALNLTESNDGVSYDLGGSIKFNF